jgi:hypothetical protein
VVLAVGFAGAIRLEVDFMVPVQDQDLHCRLEDVADVHSRIVFTDLKHSTVLDVQSFVMGFCKKLQSFAADGLDYPTHTYPLKNCTK